MASYNNETKNLTSEEENEYVLSEPSDQLSTIVVPTNRKRETRTSLPNIAFSPSSPVQHIFGHLSHQGGLSAKIGRRFFRTKNHDGRSVQIANPDHQLPAIHVHQQYSTKHSQNRRRIDEMKNMTDLSADYSRTGSLNETTETLTDIIKIDIKDIEEPCGNVTVKALQTCQRHVLLPLWCMFQFVGWRCFGAARIHCATQRWKVLNAIYTTLIILLTLFTYVFQTLACQWRLSIKSNENMFTSQPSKNIPFQTTLCTNPTSNKEYIFSSTVNAVSNTTISPTLLGGCEHIISTHLIPNLLHFIAFWMGFYHFRWQCNEELISLTEKVFLYCSSLPNRQVIQHGLIKRTRFYIILSIFWLALTLSMHFLYHFAFVDAQILVKLDMLKLSMHYFFITLDAIGFIALSAVSAVIILNYGIHCEMIICYVNTLVSRIRECSLQLKIAIKDIHTVGSSLGLLNGSIASMTALIFLMYLELCILGASILFFKTHDTTSVWAFRLIFVIHTLPILLFTLIQAGRVNFGCRILRRVALELRAYGYQNNSQLELDSFLMFVTGNTFTAKLFYMTVRPGLLLAITIAGCFAMLLLIQTGMMGKNTFI